MPFGVPHAAVATTLTAVDPDLLESALLVAVIVYVPAVGAVKVALEPLETSVPPAGDALHVTAFEQLLLALTVAVSVDVALAATPEGLAFTVTPVTVQLLPPPPFPPPPQPAMSNAPNTANESSTSHLAGSLCVIFDMVVPPIVSLRLRMGPSWPFRMCARWKQ